MGRNQYLELLKIQKKNFEYLRDKMIKLASKYNETVLDTKSNKISIAITLNNLSQKVGKENVSILGSRLFLNNVTGARVYNGSKRVKIGKHEFKGYGAHIDNYPNCYLNVACSIGMAQSEIDQLIEKIDKKMHELINK